MLERGPISKIGGLGQKEIGEEGEASGSSERQSGATGCWVPEFVEQQTEILVSCVLFFVILLQ